MALLGVPLLLVLLVGACADPNARTPGAPSTSDSPAVAGSDTPTSPSAIPSQPAPATSDPDVVDSDGHVTFGFAVPSSLVTVPHDVSVPVAPPPALPLPALAAITTEQRSGFARISFTFRAAFPQYNFQYVPQVIADGTGNPVPLEGNSFLQIRFVHAQAHNNAGKSTIESAADQQIGFPNLKSYAPAGDFEGVVSFGLGIQVAPNSDQVLAIRTTEFQHADGKGGFTFTISFDVQNG
jgi:hypothetical protein